MMRVKGTFSIRNGHLTLINQLRFDITNMIIILICSVFDLLFATFRHVCYGYNIGLDKQNF